MGWDGRIIVQKTWKVKIDEEEVKEIEGVEFIKDSNWRDPWIDPIEEDDE